MGSIRIATGSDAEVIQEIYAPFCSEKSAASFETTAPTGEVMRNRILTILKTHPWLVWEDGERVLGYAHASPHKTRAAYNWSADVSIYLHAKARRQGIGKRLYAKLLEILRQQGYFNVYAGITMPNPASVALHESFGFERIGVYERVGYKGGAWHDVAWFSLTLKKHELDPPQPTNFAEMHKDLIANSSNFL